MFPWQLKQSFLDYFGLSNVHMQVYSYDIYDFIYNELVYSSNPSEKAMDIWNTFVENHDEFFDMKINDTLKSWVTKEKLAEYKTTIQNAKNAFDASRPFMFLGCSPFCHKSLPNIVEMQKRMRNDGS
jgi:hypothetical protein